MSQSNGYVPKDNSAARMAIDNLLRRELKVGNPDDPKQVAEALLARFKDTPKAIAITREAQGLPFSTTAATPTPVATGVTSSENEWQQAVSDVERDLEELTTNAVLKDIKPELRGWAAAIRAAITEGYNAARFAMDPRQRDKALGVRRNLGDYARLARLIGALTTPITINYRKLAQSLDEVSAVLLVMTGEALSNIALNGGRYLLQVPYSELQIRRDAAINALRNLTGSAQTAYDPNDWQRGLDAYRQLYSFLESYAQGDLRILLVETELMRIMDTLIQRSQQGSIEGLRQLGATARIDIDRIRRLVTIAKQAITPPSPPLTAFVDTLQLFIDAFESSGGYRLLRIARPSYFTLWTVRFIGSRPDCFWT